MASATVAPAVLADVETMLDDALPARPLLPGLGRALVLAGGKRLRPLLAAKLGEALGVARADVARIGAAVELIHAASLLHDDVVDEATLRRDAPTANARFGAPIAVLGGDHVLVRALSLLQPFGAPALALGLACVGEMTEGALVEVQGRADAAFSVAQWVRMARGKTGALFALSLSLVALVAEAPDAERAALAAAGSNLGVAFQASDDVRDLLPEQGKRRFQDLLARNPSLVTACAAESLGFRERLARTWRASPSAEAAAELARAASRLGAPRRALDLGLEHVALAREALSHAQGSALADVVATAESMLLTSAVDVDVMAEAPREYAGALEDGR